MATRKIGDFTLKSIGNLPTLEAAEIIPSTDRLLFWDASAPEGQRHKSILFNQLPALVGEITASDAVLSVNGMTGAVTISAEALGAALAGHTHAYSSITGLQGALDAKANTVHSHVITDVGGLSAALSSKANTVHSHELADITGLETALANTAPAMHTHSIANITGLQTELDNRVDFSELALALDDKADIGHNHTISDVEGLQAALDSISSASNDPTQATKVEITTHFLTDAGGLGYQSSDSGYFTYTQETGHPGIMKVLTGGASSGRSGWRTSSQPFGFGSKAATLKALVRLPALSTDSEAYTAMVGFLISASGEAQHLLMLRYTHNVAGGNWELAARQAWSESAVNTTVPAVANTWQLVEIAVSADGSQAIARINGVQVGTIATNLPSGGSNQFVGAGFGIWKSAGSADRSLDLDYFYVSQDL